MSGKKYTYVGTKQARRILPGYMVRFEFEGTTYRDVVESVTITPEYVHLISANCTYALSVPWNHRMQVWEEGAGK